MSRRLQAVIAPGGARLLEQRDELARELRAAEREQLDEHDGRPHAVASVPSSSSERTCHARSTVKRVSWLTKRPTAPTPSGGRATISTPSGGAMSSGSAPPQTSTTSNHSDSPAHSA